jgi:hypothetical protein
MSFLTIFNPCTAGYLYGITYGITQDGFEQDITNRPIIATIETLLTGGLCALTADLGSKISVLNKSGKNILSGVLFAVAGYKLYKFIKKYSKKSTEPDLDPSFTLDPSVDTGVEK